MPSRILACAYYTRCIVVGVVVIVVVLVACNRTVVAECVYALPQLAHAKYLYVTRKRVPPAFAYSQILYLSAFNCEGSATG